MPDEIDVAMVTLPSGLAWLANSEAGRRWMDELPALLEACAQQWRLTLRDPYPYAYASLALPADLADGTSAVLKIQFPDRESEHEADALALWNGDGAIRLLAHDLQRRALLVERCEPGTDLAAEQDPEHALEVLIGLLPRLWKPTGEPFRRLAAEASGWAQRLPGQWEEAGRPFEQELVEETLAAISDLLATQGPSVLLHQDLHAGNVLCAQREPWLAIDPKPLVGEREFGVAPIVRSFELGHSRADVIGRLDRLTDALALDRERARRWCLVQTVAWTIGSDYWERHLETARWLLDG